MPSLICSWGGNADTTYATITEADDYIGSASTPGYKFNPTPWTNLSTVQKTSLLLAATRSIDNASNYVGERQFIDQTLEFPRVPAGEDRWPWVQRSYTASNTFNIYLTEQKRRVKNAVAEQAYTLAREGSDIDSHTARRMRGITSYSESVPGLSESFSYGGAVLPLCPEAVQFLKPYYGYGVELVRG